MSHPESLPSGATGVTASFSVIEEEEEERKLTKAANQPSEDGSSLCLDSHKVIRDICGLK